MTMEELNNVKGRAWEDVDVSSATSPSVTSVKYSTTQSADKCNTALRQTRSPWNHDLVDKSRAKLLESAARRLDELPGRIPIIIPLIAHDSGMVSGTYILNTESSADIDLVQLSEPVSALLLSHML